MQSCSCNDFNRAQLLRAGIARAGKGLPSIEPGMPVPAGSGMDRRSFLLRSAGAMLSVYGASALAPRPSKTGSRRRPPPRRRTSRCWSRSSWKVDGMPSPVLAPVKEAKYHELRPVLGRSEGEGQLFTEDETLMWHPQAGGLAQLHAEGKVTVFPAIGYDPPDESHFTSRHYWEVGELNAQTRSGWMGRYLDIAGSAGNPLQGLSLDYSLAPALATTKNPVAAVSTPADYNFWAYGLDEPIASSALDTFGALGALGAPSPAFAQARAAAQDTGIIRNQIAPFGEHEGKPGFTSPVTYPTSGGEFPTRLGRRRRRRPRRRPSSARTRSSARSASRTATTGSRAAPRARRASGSSPRRRPATLPDPTGTPSRRAASAERAAGTLGARGAIAQLGERLDRTQEVSGSSPLSSTHKTRFHSGFRRFQAL